MADKEYIERGALIEEFDEFDPYDYDDEFDVWLDCRLTVKNAPTADVVEVVRCEKCKYYGDEDKHVSGGSCKWHCSLVERTDFCSHGERKE